MSSTCAAYPASGEYYRRSVGSLAHEPSARHGHAYSLTAALDCTLDCSHERWRPNRPVDHSTQVRLTLYEPSSAAVCVAAGCVYAYRSKRHCTAASSRGLASVRAVGHSRTVNINFAARATSGKLTRRRVNVLHSSRILNGTSDSNKLGQTEFFETPGRHALFGRLRADAKRVCFPVEFPSSRLQGESNHESRELCGSQMSSR